VPSIGLADWFDSVVFVLLVIWLILWLVAHSGSAAGEESCEAPVEAPAQDPVDKEDVPGVAVSMGSESVKITIDEDKQATNVEHLDYFDYNVDDEGNPSAVFDKSQKGQFRCAGDSMMSFGFQLTVSPVCAQSKLRSGQREGTETQCAARTLHVLGGV
jgi:hypothetical protein